MESLLAQSEAADDLAAIQPPEIEGFPGVGAPEAANDSAAPVESRAEIRRKAEASAAFILGTGAAIVRQGLHVELEASAVREGEQRLAAVLVKYDGELPPWLTRWQEELLFGWWLATTGYGIAMAYQESKKGGGDDGAQSESQSRGSTHSVSGADRRGEVPGDETEPGASGSQADSAMG